MPNWDQASHRAPLSCPDQLPRRQPPLGLRYRRRRRHHLAHLHRRRVQLPLLVRPRPLDRKRDPIGRYATDRLAALRRAPAHRPDGIKALLSWDSTSLRGQRPRVVRQAAVALRERRNSPDSSPVFAQPRPADSPMSTSPSGGAPREMPGEPMRRAEPRQGSYRRWRLRIDGSTRQGPAPPPRQPRPLVACGTDHERGGRMRGLVADRLRRHALRATFAATVAANLEARA